MQKFFISLVLTLFLASCGYHLRGSFSLNSAIFPLQISGGVPEQVVKNRLNYPWVQKLFEVNISEEYGDLQIATTDAPSTNLIFDSQVVEENQVFSQTAEKVKNLGLIVRVSAKNKAGKTIWHQEEFAVYKNYIEPELSLDIEQEKFKLLNAMAQEIIEQIKLRLNANAKSFL